MHNQCFIYNGTLYIMKFYLMKYRLNLIALLTFALTACTSTPHSDKNLSAESLYYKGVQYLSGTHTQKNDALAFKYFNAASEQGYSPAYNALAVMYDEGMGVAQDKHQAMHYYKLAADTNEPSAAYNLAVHYYENDPNHPDLDKYLNQALAHKDSDAYNLQARIQLQRGDNQKAYQSFLKAAKQENANTQFYLYLLNLHGIGTHKNPNTALDYLKKAAKNSHPDAIFTLGSHYLSGNHVEKNPTKAFQLFNQAAELGHTKSIVNLANMYVKGEGVEQDTQKAAELFMIAAKKGDPQAISVTQSLAITK